MTSTWDSVTVDGATMKLYLSLAFFDKHLGRVAAAASAR